MTETETLAEELPEPGDRVQDGDVDQGEEEPELSGVDLARVALHNAREAARRRGAEPAAKRRSKTRQGRGLVRGEGREPVGLGGALSALMASRAWETPVAGGGVLADWPTIAPELAAHVTAVAHDAESGRLDLLPASPAWATQLRLTSASLVTRIGRQVGPGVVRSIHVLPPGSAAGAGPVPVSEAVAPAAAAPAGVEPREPSAGYRLALETLRATRPADTTAPAVRAAMQRQSAAMAREPEEAFTPVLDERLRQEAERRQEADVQRKAVLRARQERAARALPSIAPAPAHTTGFGRTA